VKLLFVAPRFHTNQVPLVKALKSAGHEVVFDVITLGASEDHTVLQPNVVAPSPLSDLLMRWRAPSNPVAYHTDHTFPSFLAYLGRLRALAPDAVVIRDPNRPFAIVAALASRLLGLRIVLYTQGEVHAPRDRRRDLLRSLVIAAFDAPWFSPVSGDRSLPRANPHMHYLPFVADQGRTPKEDWFREGRVNVLSIGKFMERKNHLLLLEAFARVSKEHDVRLTIVGEASVEEQRSHRAEVLERVDRLGLADHVEVLTNVAFEDVAELYLSHDLFVLPSRDEPAGVSILEAMAHGLPVICSTTSGTRWYVEGGRSGFVFESDDLEALVAAMTKAVADRAALVRMGGYGRRLASTVHHPDTVCAQFLQIVHQRRPEHGRRSVEEAL
jgi:glycosyltransferase involved in cell wall biosynthesis